MILGKTFLEKIEQEQRSLRRKCRIRKRFALFPVKLNSGKSAWLQFVYKVPSILPDMNKWARGMELDLEDARTFAFPDPWYATEEDAKRSSTYNLWRVVGIVSDGNETVVNQKVNTIMSIHRTG